jgi:hypothetical protein
MYSCVHSWTVHVLNQEWDANVARLALTSLPACWDTRRAGTNKGYFDFQHFAFFVHPDNRCKFVSATY